MKETLKLLIVAVTLTTIVWRCTEPALADDNVDGALSTNAPIWYTIAPLFTRTGDRAWTVSKVHVPEYPDARPVMCVASKDSQTVECFYKNNGNEEGYELTELPKEMRG